MGRSRRCWRGQALGHRVGGPAGSAPRARLWWLWQRPQTPRASRCLSSHHRTGCRRSPAPRRTLMVVAGTTVTKSVGGVPTTTNATGWLPPRMGGGHRRGWMATSPRSRQHQHHGGERKPGHPGVPARVCGRSPGRRGRPSPPWPRWPGVLHGRATGGNLARRLARPAITVKSGRLWE